MKKVKKTKKNVISMRISDAEMESLREIMEMTRMRVTEVMRAAIKLASSSTLSH